MELHRNHLYNEILEEPLALERVLQNYLANSHPAMQEAVKILRRSSMIVMTGMATSMYGCIPAQCILSAGGRASYLVDTSELLYYQLEMIPKDAAIILVSQSGESAEVRHLLLEIGKKWPVIGVYNNPESTLAKQCTVGLPIYAGAQHACGSKTNTATMAVMNILAETLAGHPLSRAGEQIEKAIRGLRMLFTDWEEKVEAAVHLLEDAEYTVFIGRGPGLASAMFSSVLFREVPKTVAEGLPAATFRHGLRENITPSHRIVAFAPAGKTRELVIRFAEEMLALGIPTLLVTNQSLSLPPSEKRVVITTEPLEENYSPLVDITPPQLIGVKLALRRGLEPGKLVISNYVTDVE
jgi:glucosamine--fructose-6-phosphate aminotransferase (isomerizing)